MSVLGVLASNAQARLWCSTGACALIHEALLHEPPLEFVSALRAAHPAAAWAALHDGRLHLHVAAESKVSLDVMEAAAGSAPSGGIDDEYSRRLPLQCAASNKASFAVLVVLLAAHPAGASAISNYG